MKKTLLALAAMTAFAGVASAQSSVTLFGIADLSARSVKNGSGGSLKTLSSDGNASSRLGFRGVEDLGGGLRAGFWLEAGMGLDSGSVGAGGGGFFNRRATVSLLGGFGELRLGRDYVPTFWNHTQFDPFGTNGVGSSTVMINPASGTSGSTTTRILGVPGAGSGGDNRTGTAVRADNTIGYFLPAMGGVYGQAMISAGEGQVGNKYVGGRIGYAAGPINVALAYGKTELFLDDLKAFNIGGTYNLGFMTLYANYNNYKVGNKEPATAASTSPSSSTGSLGVPGGRDLKNYLLGVAVPVGAGTFKFSLNNTKGDLNGITSAGAATTYKDAKATMLSAGYVYDLSKRTALYTAVSSIKNKKGARFFASGSGPRYDNSIAGFNGAADFTSTGYEFGIRHSF